MNKSVRVIHLGALNHPGGSERVAREIARALDANVTVGFDEHPWFWDEFDVDYVQSDIVKRMSQMGGKLHKLAKIPCAATFAQQDYDEDVIITNNGYSHWINTKPDQIHIKYQHDMLESLYTPSSGNLEWLYNTVMSVVNTHQTHQIDEIIANSSYISQRVEDIYGIDAPVINPPVETGKFYNSGPGDYFVMIGRMNKNKGVHLVAKAFEDLNDDLMLIGFGELQDEMESKDHVEVKKDLPHNKVATHVANAKAGIAFSKNESCGITPKEIQAAGKPVIVPNTLNLRNHVIDGQNGVVVDRSVEGVKEGVDLVRNKEWSSDKIQEYADGWSTKSFHENIISLVEQVVSE